MEILNLTKENFAEAVSAGCVLVDFWADWCMPCKILAPVLETVAARNEGKVKVCKVNVDTEPELAEMFGITGIPTVIAFKDGQAVKSAVGVQPENVYEDMIE